MVGGGGLLGASGVMKYSRKENKHQSTAAAPGEGVEKKMNKKRVNE